MLTADKLLLDCLLITVCRASPGAAGDIATTVDRIAEHMPRLEGIAEISFSQRLDAHRRMLAALSGGPIP